MKKGLIIAIVIIVILIIIGVIAFSVISNSQHKDFEERARADGVPQVCIDNGYDKDECSNYCNNNPTDCGRPTSPDNNQDEGQVCMSQCMIDKGLQPGIDCGPGSPNGPDCDVCAQQCSSQ